MRAQHRIGWWPRRGGQHRYTRCDAIGFRILRVIWLTALFARRDRVTIADYRRRFGLSLRSFRRDIALLRQAGFYLETTGVGDYRMVCFAPDFDGV